MGVSISKSVGRAFEVLEVFRETRKPSSATEIARRVGHPYSSIVAVLHNLVDVGYLNYDAVQRLYFPTHKLYRLGSWVQTQLIESADFRNLAASVCAETNQTTAISGRSFIFLNVIHIQMGNAPLALLHPRGIASTLFRSTTGLVILSQMGNADIERLHRSSNLWSRNTTADLFSNLDDVMDTVTKIRKNGFASGYDWCTHGVGAIVYPLPSPFDGTPLAITVRGRSDLIRSSAASIQSVIESHLPHGNTKNSPDEIMTMATA